jgi:hypothetical protein
MIALETGLGITKLNAELITDELLDEWVGATSSTAEREARKECLGTLTEKLRNLEESMSHLKEGLKDVNDSLL